MFHSLLLNVLIWIGFISIGFSLFFLIVIRIVRRFLHFPIPSFLVPFLDNPIRRIIQPPEKVIKWVDIHEGMRVLEIGPGSGTFTIEAANRVGNGTVLSVDIQPAVIKILKKNLLKKNVTNVVLERASAYELPFSNNAFDRVFMMSVLAEIPERKRALHEIKRVLKDTGILAVGEFIIDPDYPRQKTVITWCKNAGFKNKNGYGGFFHYVLTFTQT